MSDTANPLREVQSWLRRSALAGLVIPSTDEFLSEFAPPSNRRLRWVSGFRGSTGTAVILRDAAVLFLDSRYLLQGAQDTQGAPIAIEPSSWASRRAWLEHHVARGARLGMDPWLHSIPDLALWRNLVRELGFELEPLPSNPIDQLWLSTRPAEHRPRIVDYPVCHAGESYQAKCAALIEHMGVARLDAFLLADPEDVSWLLNVRAAGAAFEMPVCDWHVVPSCTSRAIAWRGGKVTWFVDRERLAPEVVARGSDVVEIAPPEAFIETLRHAARSGRVGADLRRTPAVLGAIIEPSKMYEDDAVGRRRWRKHPSEVQGARLAHIIDAAAVIRFAAWLGRTVRERNVNELEAAEALAAFRAQHPACKGPSMPLMSASGPSGAQPHYVPRRESSRALNAHPIFWIDSGGQYPGGTTDNTITLALGEPEPKHVFAHTVVLQGFIALATACFPAGTHATRVDTLARQALWREGMDYEHGTGHGVGNHLNIHEGPLLSRDPGPLSMIALEPGMILSNEPAYYAPGDFGVRIESHLVVIESRHPRFLQFETISRLPIDPRLVDFGRLSPAERRWLADYHARVLEDVEPLLDAPAALWLRALVESFRHE
jgi:Xaa-Pro aminopeptidase